MAPRVALGANALAATILGLTIGYGIKFGQTVHVDGSAGAIAQTRCLFIGECKTVDVDHCFWSSQVMILALALGGILVGDFTLWAFSLHSKYMDEYAPECLKKGLFARIFGPKPQRQRVEEEAGDTNPNSGMRSHESSSLFTTVLGALCCVSALALFAPHKTNFTKGGAITSYSTEDYLSLKSVVSSEGVRKGLNDLLVDSASVTKDAAVAWLGSISREKYVRERHQGQTEVRRTYRIGDTTYQGIRTNGIGVNMASFQEYFLTGLDKDRILRDHGYNTSWINAPDYRFGSLEAMVYGTEMTVVCEDVTNKFDVQAGLGTVKHTTSKPGSKPNATPLAVAYDVSNSQLGIYWHIFHELGQDFKVTPYRKVFSPEQYIVITDSSKKLFQDVSVLECSYKGDDFVTKINMRPDGIEIRGRDTNRNKLKTSHLNLVNQAISPVLEDATGPLQHALKEARVAWAGRRGRTQYDNFVMLSMVQDVLTDLASGYWSLMRQQIETSMGLPSALLDSKRQKQYEKLGLYNGHLHGSYTRLGGSLWGLILPSLLLVLPLFSLWRMLLALFIDKIIDFRARRESGSTYWQPLLQSDEEVVDYYDVPPPMPPPKDDEEEPPPPYASENGEMSAQEGVGL
ncbi:hypothetical protein PFICI_10106 [Pestalotiopsis fici W106-1]|uniref:Uncharacterized protein n=1 Tax=Pestalotiopsis fici (strain W106-1 / CGMCC3.15140) TaxID=1229662 RepID=W3WW54_PESFW|nr:uncharacterized protein PFICI_10106 [Pestalotiopsis fici W106-1]ETS78044.1 hypothetical protein PFICI_10106 [Pestalotiopsis fici W106-1]